MGNVIHKMSDHMPEGFFRLNVLLPAYMAVFSLYYCPAVQAILFLSLRDMGQAKFFLKIGLKKYTGTLSFPLLNNSGNFEMEMIS